MVLAMRCNSGDVVESRAVMSLDPDERVWLAKRLDGSQEETKAAVSILHSLISENASPDEERRSKIKK